MAVQGLIHPSSKWTHTHKHTHTHARAHAVIHTNIQYSTYTQLQAVIDRGFSSTGLQTSTRDEVGQSGADHCSYLTAAFQLHFSFVSFLFMNLRVVWAFSSFPVSGGDWWCVCLLCGSPWCAKPSTENSETFDISKDAAWPGLDFSIQEKSLCATLVFYYNNENMFITAEMSAKHNWGNSHVARGIWRRSAL